MSDRVVLEKIEWSDLTHVAGAPVWLGTENMTGNTSKRPFVRCNCGETIQLSEGHVIASSGDVQGSVLHEQCGWHVHVTLKGWSDV